ncbi:2957_t:CDS:2, partial [Scutellospora calospora]
KTPAGCPNENIIVRLRRKEDTPEADTRATALVPRKRNSEDIIIKNNKKRKEMKKVHNTRSKSEETMNTLQTATLADTNAKVHASLTTSSPNTTGSTYSDWLEIMEHEAAAENQQEELETNNFRKENSSALTTESSGNFRDERSEGESAENSHNDRSQDLNIQETETMEQDVHISRTIPLLEIAKGILL